MWRDADGDYVLYADHAEVVAGLVGVLEAALETLDGIANSNWRKWEELASCEEYERWSKSRCAHEATKLHAALAAHKEG